MKILHELTTYGSHIPHSPNRLPLLRITEQRKRLLHYQNKPSESRTAGPFLSLLPGSPKSRISAESNTSKANGSRLGDRDRATPHTSTAWLSSATARSRSTKPIS